VVESGRLLITDPTVLLVDKVDYLNLFLASPWSGETLGRRIKRQIFIKMIIP